MAVTVGTDTYGDETGLTAYATARGVTISGDETQLLIKAMDYLESQRYLGRKYLYTQALQFPRWPYDLYEGDEEGEVPTDIITAQYVAALLIDSGEDLNPVIGRATKVEKVDVIEVEYQEGASESSRYPQLTRLLSRFLATGFGYPVYRA